MGGLHVLESKIKATPYPYGFEPTLHRYRLNQPERQEGAADHLCVFHGGPVWPLGADGVDPGRAGRLPAGALAQIPVFDEEPSKIPGTGPGGPPPHAENFWYGSTVANEDAAAAYPMPWANINTFWSMEPLLEPVDMNAAEGLPQWVILGAETGNRRDKVVPRRGVGGADRGLLRRERDPRFLQRQPAGLLPGPSGLCPPLGRPGWSDDRVGRPFHGPF